MTVIAPSPADFRALDARISRALKDLRAARRAAARGLTAGTVADEARAEEHLNVLLDYRNAARLRHP